jgi:hypothetical protein
VRLPAKFGARNARYHPFAPIKAWTGALAGYPLEKFGEREFDIILAIQEEGTILLREILEEPTFEIYLSGFGKPAAPAERTEVGLVVYVIRHTCDQVSIINIV